MQREIALLKELQHENIVQYLGLYINLTSLQLEQGI